MTLLQLYRELEPTIETEIAAFRAKSLDMVRAFRANTTIPEELDKLDTIETQIDIRIDEVRKIAATVRTGLERVSLGLHQSGITESIQAEAEKKNDLSRLSPMTTAPTDD